MDSDPQNLSELERRLARWRPGADGLDADAMLFAAGRAAGRRRWTWPALGAMALLSVGLGAWALHERGERIALSGRLDEMRAAPGTTVPVDHTPSPYVPSSDDQFSLRRRMEQDPDRWLSSPPSEGAPLTPPPEPVIFRAGQLID